LQVSQLAANRQRMMVYISVGNYRQRIVDI
jgi:hypothetical protein